MINIDKLKLMPNYVLIKPDEDYHTFQVNGRETGILTAEHELAAGHRKAVFGTVIKSCDKLVFNGDKIEKRHQSASNDMSYLHDISRMKEASVMFDVPVEVQSGDRVMFDYIVHYESYKNGLYTEIDGQDYFFVKYDQLFAKISDDSIYPLNGLVLVEALEREEKFSELGLYLPKINGKGEFDTEKLLKGKKLQLGEVLVSGCVCKGYIEFPEAGDDRHALPAGMTVLFKWAYAKPFEYELHHTLFPNKTVLVLNRKDIVLYISDISKVTINL